MNITHLATVHDLYLGIWLTNPTVQTILKHVENLQLKPKYEEGGSMFLCLELLHTLLVPSFMSPATPEVPVTLVEDLIDRKVTDAKSRMDDNLRYIKFHDRREVVIAKTDAAKYMIQDSLNRLREAEGAYHRLVGIEEANGRRLSRSHCEKIDEILLAISYTVPEIGPILSRVREALVLPRINREFVLVTVIEELRQLINAIRCEITIRSVDHRILLAQLMIHEAFTQWTETQAKRLPHGSPVLP